MSNKQSYALPYPTEGVLSEKQRQKMCGNRLWLTIGGVSLVIIAISAVVYILLSNRSITIGDSNNITINDDVVFNSSRAIEPTLVQGQGQAQEKVDNKTATFDAVPTVKIITNDFKEDEFQSEER